MSSRNIGVGTAKTFREVFAESSVVFGIPYVLETVGNPNLIPERVRNGWDPKFGVHGLPPMLCRIGDSLFAPFGALPVKCETENRPFFGWWSNFKNPEIVDSISGMFCIQIGISSVLCDIRNTGSGGPPQAR